jgi:ABC-type polysaccharide/polyol phosphate transport system ATPase subunit
MAVATTDTSEDRRKRLLEEAPPVVSVQDVRKTFRIPHRRYSTLKERMLHPLTSSEVDELPALNGVSFEIPSGEFLGVVGRNGSGKSTLLKCLAGIYDIDSGAIRVEGRLSPFIELGVGFNPDLSARDNVVINAVMLGLTPSQARQRFDHIIAFAELEDFVDLKLKNYSSGMSVRLAFAVAIEVDAEILLVDEVLAVGDASFQQKCFEEFQKMKDGGRTIIFVTHDMSAVERFCDRAMLIENGGIVEVGEPARIARRYNELNFGRLTEEDSGAGERWGDQRAAEIVAAWFENAAGERVLALQQGETCRMCFEVNFHESLEDPVFAATLRNEAGQTIVAASSAGQPGPIGHFGPGDPVVIRFSFVNWLAHSRYRLSPSVIRAGDSGDTLDLREDLASLMTHSPRHSGGVVDVPTELEISRL